MEADIRHMKWWGWGHEDVTFDDSTKPELWPYLKRELGVDEIRWEMPVAFEDVTLPEQKNNVAFLAAFGVGLGEGTVAFTRIGSLVRGLVKKKERTHRFLLEMNLQNLLSFLVMKLLKILMC